MPGWLAVMSGPVLLSRLLLLSGLYLVSELAVVSGLAPRWAAKQPP
jgi:hypothetical protein